MNNTTNSKRIKHDPLDAAHLLPMKRLQAPFND